MESSITSLSLTCAEDGITLMTAELLLPPSLPVTVSRRIEKTRDELKKRLSESVFPELCRYYAAEKNQKKRVTIAPCRLRITLTKKEETEETLTLAEAVAVLHRGRRLYFSEKIRVYRIRDGKLLPPPKQRTREKKAKKREKAKTC